MNRISFSWSIIAGKKFGILNNATPCSNKFYRAKPFADSGVQPV